ncbi:MAG TPA: class I SAM-dependent methyltransferase [Ignavibacteria bacterium]|nr:class I SAM-dependent methyltransferase [Ignavibacteria bacterium]
MLNKEFYDSFAEDYNSMIPLEKQVESKTKFFKRFIYDDTKSAADLGAGSGADSIALAKLDLYVTAFEPSSEMVTQAKQNFINQNVKVEIHKKRIMEIDNSFHNSFDLVVSLGNTFANINKEEIEGSVVKVLDLLKENGKAIIQILNYDKVLKEKERIVNITESDKKQFIRFYDFCDEKVHFNLLSFYKNDLSNRKLITTEIFPYTKTYMEGLFQKSENVKIEFYGDMKMSEFDSFTSNNLIIVVRK